MIELSINWELLLVSGALLIAMALLFTNANKIVAEFKPSTMEILNNAKSSAQKTIDEHIQQQKAKLPLRQLINRIESARHKLTLMKEAVVEADAKHNEKQTWWEKFAYGPRKTNTSKLEASLFKLEELRTSFDEQYRTNLLQQESALSECQNRAEQRIQQAFEAAQNLNQKFTSEHEAKRALAHGSWLGFLSVPAFAAEDLYNAQNVYDALRSVNGHYEGMSDFDIWLETLLMPDAQLAGLASLTKGAYFEQLVAADLGGVLHENFNHPGTDMLLGNTEFQLKATDSSAYVDGVDASIPVIATSEVAEQTAALDSGITNQEITREVDLALGGSVVNVTDTVMDSLLVGLGGVGVFATIRGINHVVEAHKNDKDICQALDEGLMIVIDGTGRATFGLAETTYKVASSDGAIGFYRFLWAFIKGLTVLTIFILKVLFWPFKRLFFN